MGGYDNPVVRGHAPDPSAIRVGDDYYLATSSFGMLPGIPIRHSTDLVNWRIIGHAVTRPSQFRRDGQPGAITLFAPTIRYHDGRFFVVCTNPIAGQGNFLVSTTDPAGEWSDAVWLDEDAFDPSLFRDDDGTWLYTRRSLRFDRPDGALGAIVQAEVDVQTGELGTFRPLTPNDRGFETNDIEGPHLYKIGEWYYLTGAEGSSWKGHMQTIGRSRSPWGPFEPAPHNPILTHRDRVGHPVQSVGHTELIEAADGSWWALSLGTRHAPLAQHHNIGRETFLTPVHWTSDGWPVIGVGGSTELRFDDIELPKGIGTVAAPDTLWTRGWTTLGMGPDGLESHRGGDPSRVTLPAGVAVGAPHGAVGALLRSQTADDQRFATTVAAPPADGLAGIAVVTDARHQYSAIIEGAGAERRVRMVRQVDDLIAEESRPLPGDGPVRLEIEARPDYYTFRVGDASGMSEVGHGSARLLSAEAAEWFVAAHFALLNISGPGSTAVEFTDIEHVDLAPHPPAVVLPF